MLPPISGCSSVRVGGFVVGSVLLLVAKSRVRFDVNAIHERLVVISEHSASEYSDMGFHIVP